MPVPGRIHVGADHANVRECFRVSGKRLIRCSNFPT
jgi:hypothetical protein